MTQNDFIASLVATIHHGAKTGGPLTNARKVAETENEISVATSDGDVFYLQVVAKN